MEKIYPYSTVAYPFEEQLQTILGLKGRGLQCKQLHLVSPGLDTLPLLQFEQDTTTQFHTQVYRSPHFPFLVGQYQKFVQEVILPELQAEFGTGEFLVQREPSVRIQLPNNTALGRRAEESSDEQIGLHCDADYNHPPEEINFILSITGQEGTNSLYVETEPGKGDFRAIAIRAGEVFRFYGNKCRHHNKINRTGDTRISLDFRVIPGSVVAGQGAVAVHSGRPFTAEEGGYYTLMRVAAMAST